MLNRYYLDELDFELSCPIELLQTQWHIMGAYLKILEQRFLVEGIYFND
ncbi:TPA: crAss001_48 related protein [Streptococcus pyogenes]